jgi:hypothetical protein
MSLDGMIQLADRNVSRLGIIRGDRLTGALVTLHRPARRRHRPWTDSSLPQWRERRSGARTELATGAYTAFLDLALGFGTPALGLLADFTGLGTVFVAGMVAAIVSDTAVNGGFQKSPENIKLSR